jgi:hypothetical protein
MTEVTVTHLKEATDEFLNDQRSDDEGFPALKPGTDSTLAYMSGIAIGLLAASKARGD